MGFFYLFGVGRFGSKTSHRLWIYLSTAAIVAIAFIFRTPRARAQSVALSGNYSPAAAGLSARASAQQSLRLHIFFQLRNREDLSQLLSDQQNPSSPRYHRWLTPEQFDSRFGRTPAEVRAVSKWLSARGLRVLSASNRKIDFSATVAQTEAAFATTIAASADGASYGNVSEPQIPEQFVDVIGSIEGLDNLRHWMPILPRSKTPSKQSKAAPDKPASRPALSATKAVADRSCEQ